MNPTGSYTYPHSSVPPSSLKPLPLSVLEFTHVFKFLRRLCSGRCKLFKGASSRKISVHFSLLPVPDSSTCSGRSYRQQAPASGHNSSTAPYEASEGHVLLIGCFKNRVEREAVLSPFHTLLYCSNHPRHPSFAMNYSVSFGTFLAYNSFSGLSHPPCAARSFPSG